MESIDWKKLEKLRDFFLRASIPHNYWEDRAALELYERFFAQRIAWKWESVLDELVALDFFSKLHTKEILDWGCGSAIASRTLFKRTVLSEVSGVRLVDRSKLALSYAKEMLSPLTENVQIATHVQASDQAFMLLVSHVVNELNSRQLDELVSLAEKSSALIWIEPGTHLHSRKLSVVRDRLLATHQMQAPCTHQKPCPMLQEKHADDWCHHFARIPTYIFQDGDWARFGKTMGIDLHRLPYSYLAAHRKDLAAPHPRAQSLRQIGQKRVYKGFSKIELCSADGLIMAQVSKRRNPETMAALEAGSSYVPKNLP